MRFSLLFLDSQLQNDDLDDPSVHDGERAHQTERGTLRYPSTQRPFPASNFPLPKQEKARPQLKALSHQARCPSGALEVA
jgi:hypothetical protein